MQPVEKVVTNFCVYPSAARTHILDLDHQLQQSHYNVDLLTRHIAFLEERVARMGGEVPPRPVLESVLRLKDEEEGDVDGDAYGDVF